MNETVCVCSCLFIVDDQQSTVKQGFRLPTLLESTEKAMEAERASKALRRRLVSTHRRTVRGGMSDSNCPCKVGGTDDVSSGPGTRPGEFEAFKTDDDQDAELRKQKTPSLKALPGLDTEVNRPQRAPPPHGHVRQAARPKVTTERTVSTASHGAALNDAQAEGNEIRPPARAS